MKVSISYAVRTDGETAWIRESLDATSQSRVFGPMPKSIIESFIRLRREYWDEIMRSKNAPKLITANFKLAGTLQ